MANTGAVAALQAALAAENAAIFGYGVAGAHLTGSSQAAAERDWTAHNLDRRATHATNPIEFTGAVRNLGAACQKLQRVTAEDHGYGTGLTTVEVFLAVQSTMLAG